MSCNRLVVVSGGVGAARFLRGLVDVVAYPGHVTAIVNVADDFTLHGLSISPDLDTVMYTLADATDTQRGWGLRDETWNAMSALSRYGDRDWFSLGDKDLATHLQRTARLAEGATLTEVTAELATAWGIEPSLLPVSNDPVSTRVTRADTGEEIEFQEYFVGHKHDVPVNGVRFAGIDNAQLTNEVADAIAAADAIIIAPSNPIVSIAPVLAVPGFVDALTASTAVRVAVSPIIGGKALKGPAAELLGAMGHEVSAVGVASLWADLIDVLLIDDADAARAVDIAATGVVPFVTDTVMADPVRRAHLARSAVAACVIARSLRGGSQT